MKVAKFAVLIALASAPLNPGTSFAQGKPAQSSAARSEAAETLKQDMRPARLCST
jgi:hypothetical protein